MQCQAGSDTGPDTVSLLPWDVAVSLAAVLWTFDGAAISESCREHVLSTLLVRRAG